MRNILFVGNIQGEGVARIRGIKRNRSLAGSVKAQGICSSLLSRGHNVDIYSMASVAERKGTWFGPMQETVATACEKGFTIYYGSTVDNRVLRHFVEFFSALRWIAILFRENSINTVYVYNILFLTVFVALWAKLGRKDVYLEYEDAVTVVREGNPSVWKRCFRLHEIILARLLNGVYAPSPELLDMIGISPRLHMPGIVAEDLLERSSNRLAFSGPAGPLKLLYSGNLDSSKGIDLLLKVLDRIEFPLEIHICGKGPLEQELKALCDSSRHEAIFHGYISRQELISLQTSIDVGLNPHRTDLHVSGCWWPFKVVEYLAGCGTVFCARSGRIPPELEKRLFLFESNEIDEMENAFRDLISQWPILRKKAGEHMQWAKTQFGPEGIGKALDELMNTESKKTP